MLVLGRAYDLIESFLDEEEEGARKRCGER